MGRLLPSVAAAACRRSCRAGSRITASCRSVLPAEGKRRARVALFIGCAADAFFPQTTLATARVLQKQWLRGLDSAQSGLLRALHYHSGLVEPAQQLRRRPTARPSARTSSADVDAIINNAGGCGPVLKEYGHLLDGTPAEKRRTASPTRCATSASSWSSWARSSRNILCRCKATYHDACGLSHAQKIRQPPRQLLGMIPGLELVPLPESEHCCGAAGSYNLTQPEMSAAAGQTQGGQHPRHGGAGGVHRQRRLPVANQPAICAAQRPDIWVAHPIDALWAAYCGHNPLAGPRKEG